MVPSRIPFWKNAPFFRLLVPLAAGILIQWFLHPPQSVSWWFMIFSSGVLAMHAATSVKGRFRWRFTAAVAIQLLLCAAGMLLLYHKDVRYNRHWIGSIMQPSDGMVLRIGSQAVEKTNSYKYIAQVDYLVRPLNNSTINIPAKGGLYVYMEKDRATSSLLPGHRIFLPGNAAPVLPSGNPHAFDYQQYSVFQGITHQVYIRARDLHQLAPARMHPGAGFFPGMQAMVLRTIRRYVPGRREAGLAEALLIGYKQDLDPELVSDYTNTGLAHVIAISGMHLALVYWILLILLRPLGKIKALRFLSPVLTIAGLWIFTILAGAQPSVLRSAVMFSCIVAGRSFARNHSIYNSLCASAFMLLCFNPFWLWDLGFQLSYAAVLSLLIFMKPIYHCLMFTNHTIDLLWKSVAVSISAQVLTIPMTVFYFHQFPNYFIVSNLVAVPLSTAILFAEIVLCTFAMIPSVAIFIGVSISGAIRWLNEAIDWISKLPFSTMEGLQISLLQAFLLYGVVHAVYAWLTWRSAAAFRAVLWLISGFVILRSQSFLRAASDRSLIVYNVPKKSSVEWVEGRNCIYLGDTLNKKEFDFHLKPFHLFQRMPLPVPQPALAASWASRGPERIIYLGSPLRLPAVRLMVQSQVPVAVDILILNRRSAGSLPDIFKCFRPRLVVLDSSIPEYAAGMPFRVCDSMGIPCYIVSRAGAFIHRLR